MDIAGLNILVTGGAGFLGSHIAERLVSLGARVRILDTFLSGRDQNLLPIQGRISLYQGDIVDQGVVDRAMEGVQVVVHCAFPLAAYDRSLDNQFIHGGSVGLFNILKAALREKALVVFSSSIAVYGQQQYLPIDENHPVQPILLYGVTKLAGEFYCLTMAHTYGLKTVILRIADIYGPRNGRVSAPIDFLLKGMGNQPMVIKGDGSQTRTYTYISDLVDAVILAITCPQAQGEIINIAGDDCISISDLAILAKQITGSTGKISLEQAVVSDGRKYWIDNRKAKSLLGFAPKVDISSGLRQTLAWLKADPDYFSVL
ncbi:MAG: NAD-dependent epimerase/dehydratase family protein [Clostridia bacterium]|nr:NAD-dependent epimerase/dehydratase family protein [Clostridia bacterium]